MENENCRLCKEHSGIVKEVEELMRNKEQQWLAIDKLRNRLPLWATLVISILMFLLGLSIRYGNLGR